MGSGAAETSDDSSPRLAHPQTDSGGTLTNARCGMKWQAHSVSAIQTSAQRRLMLPTYHRRTAALLLNTYPNKCVILSSPACGRTVE